MFNFTAFRNGVAIVGTMSAEIGTSSPVLLLMLTQATFILLLSGCVEPNADRHMSSWWWGVSDSSVRNNGRSPDNFRSITPGVSL